MKRQVKILYVLLAVILVFGLTECANIPFLDNMFGDTGSSVNYGTDQLKESSERINQENEKKAISQEDSQNAQTHLDNGKQLFDENKNVGAIREFDEAIRLNPNFAEAYAYRARAYIGDNNEQALSDANMAIKLNPRSAMGFYVRGRLQNDNDRKIMNYTEAIYLDHTFSIAYIYRGLTYYNMKNFDSAITDFTEAIKLEPTARNYNYRGAVYLDKKDYDRAIADCTEAIRLDPQYANAYANRGNVYYGKKDYERAIIDYEAALKIDPNNSLAKSNLPVANREFEAEKRQRVANAEAEKNRQANEAANRYDPSKFTVVPSNFRPADYTKVDLFRAVSTSKNLEISSNKYDAMNNQLKTDLSFGLVGGNYYLMYVSDVTFVRQNGTDITFSSDDNAISQMMSIDQRSGLQAGQRVRVYYTLSRSPLTTWDIVAIERR